ncbi:MAG: Asp-tRNA(Asn)/Glu-tRNA(Gln) amidotransferase subunit GatB [Patescibacteria group bacterium]
MKYEPVIGLEIHAELNTRTKMFCASLNDPLEKHPNVNICPVCMGHPGTLPVINREAVEKVICVGLALGGEISSYSQFDRKNYFYPDLPKGYQISQYKYPLVSGGILNDVRITRVHLEEDAGRLQHSKNGTLVDYNRAGVPLMELVTEPDIRSAAEARAFAEELRKILRYVHASDADMEKGQMRIEANISIRPAGALEFGTKVEVKNINSFRAVEKAILYVVQRHAEILNAGERVKQETRGWDDGKEITVPQRSKEEAHDYRYFPEPDLPPLCLTKDCGWDIEALRSGLPELPIVKRVRFREQYGLSEKMALFFADDKYFADYFEQAASELNAWLRESADEERARAVGILANYLSSDLQALFAEKAGNIRDVLITPENMAELVKMIYKNEVSSRAAKDVLQRMFADGSDPSQIVEEGGLKQVSDAGALEAVVKKIVEENPKPTADYKAGKQAALQVLVGKVMQETKGSANPEVTRDLLTRILK